MGVHVFVALALDGEMNTQTNGHVGSEIIRMFFNKFIQALMERSVLRTGPVNTVGTSGTRTSMSELIGDVLVQSLEDNGTAWHVEIMIMLGARGSGFGNLVLDMA